MAVAEGKIAPPSLYPARHSSQEEAIISAGIDEAFFRYGWEGAYMAAKKRGYTRSYSGFIYAVKRMGFAGGSNNKKKTRVHKRRYPELLVPGKKVQIDVKEVSYCCLKGAAIRARKRRDCPCFNLTEGLPGTMAK